MDHISEESTALRKKIKALIVFRVLFVTLLFGSSFLFGVFEKFPYAHILSYLIISLYLVNIVYSLLLGRLKNLVAFAYAQLSLDVIFEIMLIYITGGISSWFSFALLITIIASSIVLHKKAGYIMATLSSVLYGILVNLQFYGLLPAPGAEGTGEEYYLYKLFVHIISFYLTAFLSGYLSSRLEKTVKKLEEKDLDLRDLEFFNREVVESLPSGLFTTDTSGKVLIFNRAAERITDTGKDAVIGQRIDSILPYFVFPFSEGRKEEFISVGGDLKIIGLTISLLKGIDESPKGFIVVFQDLTQIKKLETEIKQKEKWAAIGELSSNIAHEIRNPLASLKGSIEMLKENSVPKNYKERLMEIALSEMDRLNRIITDFLTYSRPAPPEFEKIDLHGLLDETIELLRNVDQNKGSVSIRKNYSGTVEVNADPKKMRQVFWNLGINAVEAMPGGGELTVSTKNTNEFVEITFKDTGTGIDKSNSDNIFYPFFTTKEQGTGLGLAIAYRIIEEHKGRLNVQSSSGNGTTFEIILPKTNETV
jgi:two-component system sensor histidine kinase PilS (NtrC family)